MNIIKNFFNKLNPLAFVISFLIGLYICYSTLPPKKIIVKHPTPQNANKTIYRDENDNCFKYKADIVSCPSDTEDILNHPLNIN